MVGCPSTVLVSSLTAGRPVGGASSLPPLCVSLHHTSPSAFLLLLPPFPSSTCRLSLGLRLPFLLYTVSPVEPLTSRITNSISSTKFASIRPSFRPLRNPGPCSLIATRFCAATPSHRNWLSSLSAPCARSDSLLGFVQTELYESLSVSVFKAQSRIHHRSWGTVVSSQPDTVCLLDGCFPQHGSRRSTALPLHHNSTRNSAAQDSFGSYDIGAENNQIF